MCDYSVPGEIYNKRPDYCEKISPDKNGFIICDTPKLHHDVVSCFFVVTLPGYNGQEEKKVFVCGQKEAINLFPNKKIISINDLTVALANVGMQGLEKMCR